MKTVVIINHSVESCGVYQYGKRLANILIKSEHINFIYHEIDTFNQYINLCNTNLDAIIYNYHPSTLPWLTNQNIQNKVPNIGIHHENEILIHFNYILEIDASDFPNSIYRPLLNYIGDKIINDIPIIGSFGFGFNNKGFDKIISYVNSQFDNAIIKLNITSAYFSDNNDQTEAMCHIIPRKEGIKLIITHDFMDDDQLLTWLNNNTINIFLYDHMHGRGCASTIDYALSVNTPIGISDSYMFRHIYSDEICVYKTPIKDIIKNGMVYIEKYKTAWSHLNLIKKVELYMLKAIFSINK